MIDVQWITVGYPRNTSQKRLEIYWDIRPLSLSLSLLIYIRIYAYIDHYWIWLGHATKKSWLSLHIDLGFSSTQGLPTVEGPLRDGGTTSIVGGIHPDKPLHPNNITWHPLDSHASFFSAQRWQCFCGAGTNYSHRDCAGVTTHGRGGGDALGERDTTRVAAKTSTMGCMGSRRSSWEMAPGLYNYAERWLQAVDSEVTLSIKTHTHTK